MEKLNSSEEYDPYKQVEVIHKRCTICTIRLVEGRNITKGWMYDYMDTPDPYVVLRVKSSPEGTQTTEPMSNTKNPKWNQKFRFLLDGDAENDLKIMLMESDTLMDNIIGTVNFNLNDLPLNKTLNKTFIFNEVTEIDVELHMEYDPKPVLRYSMSLCDEEKQFLKKRKEKVMKGMQKLLGEKGPKELSHVPTVAVIGSGGGFRAMIGLNGAVRALAESGVLDCVTYLVGLSGSSWYMSTLYSHPEWPKKSPDELTEELKNSVDSSLMWLLTPQSLLRYLDDILEKRNRGQPVSFTDIFGHLVGETLLKGRRKVRLTEQQTIIKDGDIPFPLYTCVHVKRNVSALKFQEWVEISPYEVGIPKYGTFIKTHLFNSKVFLGQLSKQYEEPPLHYIQGICGSAYSILCKRLFGNEKAAPNVTEDEIRHQMCETLDGPSDYVSSDSSDSEEECDGQAQGEKQEKAEAGGNFSKGKFQMGKPVATQKSKEKSYWSTIVNGMFSGYELPIIRSRSGVAALILNPLRGDPVKKSYPYSPFTDALSDKGPEENPEKSSAQGDAGNPTNVQGDNEDGKQRSSSSDGKSHAESRDGQGSKQNSSGNDASASYYEEHTADEGPDPHKRAYFVDAGIAMNLPFPIIVRPQRQVDVILSYNFSARESDSAPHFKELLLAEQWARSHNVPFPPINLCTHKLEDLKEVYVFRHPTDPYCPIVLHFVLANINFRKYKAPGLPRENEEEFKFGDFTIFDEPSTPYSTFNFKYTHQQFDRLSELMKFNTLLSIPTIKEIIAECVEKKQRLPSKRAMDPVIPKHTEEAKLARNA